MNCFSCEMSESGEQHPSLFQLQVAFRYCWICQYLEVSVYLFELCTETWESSSTSSTSHRYLSTAQSTETYHIILPSNGRVISYMARKIFLKLCLSEPFVLRTCTVFKVCLKKTATQAIWSTCLNENSSINSLKHKDLKLIVIKNTVLWAPTRTHYVCVCWRQKAGRHSNR